ncbi:carboxylesterase family protein [Catenulispora sp. NF23]|uniref:carboxylesterase/lipase family protein n=1 Tax=Catenulispora pinistramenti TaxID=2705254 RepID=UPI001BA6F40B|nr:carboxylesterase family protein [Catenulispora pinistramenti]MBS2531545.1 carboxylesterase family protein [Catenulispora pinistramenti]
MHAWTVWRRPYIAGIVTAVAMVAVAVMPGLSYSAARPVQSSTAPPACSAGTLVPTGSGPVCGITAGRQTSYLDIPYAAPPLGKLRWTPPQPVQPWTATYQATQRGPGCLAPSYTAPGQVQPGTTENCLFLEVQEPAGTRPGQRLPVMFEIHGGGFLGEARDDDGTNFVGAGPAIYVYAGYRLGVMGFLADQALGPHSGDFGLQDQQAALSWVKDNIAGFGGDPGNVTIFGESAGGASVCDQIASPTANGLFQRGISISGYYNFDVNTIWWPADCKSTLPDEAQAQGLGARFAAKAGCGNAADVAACLRALPADTLVEKGGQGLDPFGGGAIGPIVNGTTLTMSASQAFALGRVNRVKVVIGVGRDEFNGGVYTNTPGHPVVADTTAQYEQLVRQQFGPLASTVLRLYPVQHYPSPSPFIAYRTVMADAFSVCPSLESYAKLARAVPVYAYEDDDADSPGQTQPLGANHSAINRLAHDVPGTLDPNQLALQEQVLSEWTGFARTGVPTAPGTPPWALFSVPGNPVMSLRAGGDSTLVPAGSIATQHNCQFWDSVNRTAPWAS